MARVPFTESKDDIYLGVAPTRARKISWCLVRPHCIMDEVVADEVWFVLFGILISVASFHAGKGFYHRIAKPRIRKGYGLMTV